MRLVKTLQARGPHRVREVLRQELEALDASLLPLQAGLSRGSHLTDAPIRVMIIDLQETDQQLIAKVGVFYSSIIAGCSCADDPTPTPEASEYCELQLNINLADGETFVRLLD